MLRKSLKSGRAFSKRINLTVVCSICFMYSLLSDVTAHRAAFWVLVRVSNLYTATITRQNKETLIICFYCHKSHLIFFLDYDRNNKKLKLRSLLQNVIYTIHCRLCYRLGRVCSKVWYLTNCVRFVNLTVSSSILSTVRKTEVAETLPLASMFGPHCIYSTTQTLKE